MTRRSDALEARIVFRGRNCWPRETPRSLLLEPRDASLAGNVARAVADGGAAALVGDSEAPREIYAPASPTFDDLLAIWLLRRPELPSDRVTAILCEHARMRRLGHWPGEIAFERTPAAVLNQIRRGYPELEQPDQAEDLVRRSAELFDLVTRKLEAGADMLRNDLLGDSVGFQEEIALLRADRQLYAEDRSRGRVFEATIRQGRVERRFDLLFIDSPVSTHFAAWARRDERSPSGNGFALTLVRWTDGRWILSSDPAQRVDVSWVAGALDRAEEAKRGEAPPEAWYDGRVQGGTMVVSPREGTALDEKEILGVLTKELDLRGGVRRSLLLPLTVGAAALPTIGLAIYISQQGNGGNGGGSRRDPDPVSPIDPRTLYGHVHAMIVGIDRYQDPKLNLDYAVGDAKGMKQLLERRFQIDTFFEIYNEDATRENLHLHLQDQARRRQEDDALLIFWAGHGATFRGRGGTVGYLVPFDGSMENMGQNFSMSEVRDLVDTTMPAKHKFLIVDACYAGLLAKRGAVAPPNADASYLRDITDRKAFQIMTAGDADQQVLDGGANGHSVFTERLLAELDTAADGPGYITAASLFPRVQQQVSDEARRRNHPQLPRFERISGSGDFVFVAK